MDRCPGEGWHRFLVDLVLPDRAEIGAGRRGFDPAAAAACLAGVVPGCPQWGLLDYAECHQVFPPRCPVGPGSPCRGPSDCGEAMWCRFDLDVCEGACEPRQPVGGTCSRLEQCLRPTDGSVAWCHMEEGSLLGVCVGLRPRAEPAAVGERCALVDGEPVYCADGLTCRRLAGSVVQVCEVSDGRTPCGPSTACPTGSRCDNLWTQGNGRCVESPPVRVVRIGESCTRGDACDQAWGSQCIEGRCREAGTAENAPCMTYGSLGICDAPLTCDPGTRRCARAGALPLDTACLRDSDCSSGRCCRVTDAVSDQRCCDAATCREG